MAHWNLAREIAANCVASNIALICGDEQRTYGQLFAAAEGLARRIRLQWPDTAGLRIGLLYPSGIDYVPLALGILLADACFVPIPSELSAAEKLALAQSTALHGIIALPTDELAWLGVERASSEVLRADDGAAQLVAFSAPAVFPEATFAALNPAFIRFSSGTTGQSKGIVLSHESLLARIISANIALGISRGERVLWVLPMAHHFAVSIMLYLYHGATTVIEEQHFGEQMLQVAVRHGATLMYGSPFHYRQLVGCEEPAWPQLRLAVSTAAALDRATALAFASRFGIPLTQGLGIIEVGLPILNTVAADSVPEAIGQPIGAQQVALRDDHGQPCAQGEVGQLWLRGPGMFDAYLVPWQPRAEVTDEDGWFATGDLARQDEQGLLHLCGRMKSLINVAGMKVFPEEVERVLDQHSGVQRSLVEAQPHAEYGEIPVARIISQVSKPSVGELRKHCRSRLAGYKVPLRFEFVDELPLTASGKLKRT
jgi:long-chain acyl-CoA synthetase